MSYGAQVKFGIARQAATGAPVTSPTSFHGLPFVSEGIGLEKQELISQNLSGRYSQGAAYDGLGNVAGDYNAEITPRNLLAMLAAAVNYAPASVTSGSVVTRTFIPNTTDFDAYMVKAPFTIYKQFADAASAEQFYDCQFGQLKLDFSAGQFTRIAATVVGGARAATGVGSAAIVADAADAGRLFPWNVASLSLGGAAVGNFSAISVALNENMAPLYSMNGTLTPFKYSRDGFQEVTVSGTFYMTDRTTLNDFVAGTQKRLLITAVCTVGAVQSGYYNTFVVDVPQLKVTQFKPVASGPGEVAVSFTGRGVTDPSSNYSIQYTHVSSYVPGL